MSNTIVNPPALNRPSGYSHGLLLAPGARVLVLAGQTGMDQTGAIVEPGDLAAQYRRALANLQAVLAAAGGAMTDIVKLNLFITDKAQYKASLKPLGAIHREFFGRYYPAVTLVEVKSLYDDDALVEIEGWAALA